MKQPTNIAEQTLCSICDENYQLLSSIFNTLPLAAHMAQYKAASTIFTYNHACHDSTEQKKKENVEQGRIGNPIVQSTNLNFSTSCPLWWVSTHTHAADTQGTHIHTQHQNGPAGCQGRWTTLATRHSNMQHAKGWAKGCILHGFFSFFILSLTFVTGFT